MGVGMWIIGTGSIAVMLVMALIVMLMCGLAEWLIVLAMIAMWLLSISALVVLLLIVTEPAFWRLVDRVKTIIVG